MLKRATHAFLLIDYNNQLHYFDSIDDFRKYQDRSTEAKHSNYIVANSESVIGSQLEKHFQKNENNKLDIIIQELKEVNHIKTSVVVSDSSKKDEVDMVNHPPHYTHHVPETILMIQAILSPEEFKGYCKGSIIKYRDRAGKKGAEEDAKKDYEKAEFYYNCLKTLIDNPILRI